VNFVIGFRPELWSDIAPGDAPSGVEGFNDEIRGTEGFVMPGTQLVTGQRDALTRFTVPLTGSYYFVPSVQSLRRLRGP
jgi:hypothetical protein